MADAEHGLRSDPSESRGSEWRDSGVLSLVVMLWDHRWLMVVVVTVCGVLGVAAALLLPTTWRATSTLVPSSQLEPQSASGASGILGAARSLGLSGGLNANSSALFGPILMSRKLRGELLERRYRTSDGENADLAIYLAGDAEESERREVALAILREDVLSLTTDIDTGVTTVAATLGDPALASRVVNLSVSLIDSLNQEAKSRQARAWVEFISGRVAKAEKELRESEEKLQDFRQQNRAGSSLSPALSIQESRLTRAVEIAQESYVTLRTQLELARVEQAKTIPVISVIDKAIPPVSPNGPPRAMIVALSILIGILIAIALIISLQLLRAMRTS